MRIYTAGPMTHHPQYNFPAFDRLAASLRAAGHDVISPAELDDPADRAAALASPDGAPQTAHHFGKTWGDFLARDVKLLADDGIEAVVVLDDWQTSRGARLETFVANALCGMPVYMWDWTYRELRPVPRITLFRAWCDEPLLSIAHSFGKVAS